MTNTTRPCPACGAVPVPFSRLMCQECWDQVPAKLRRLVNEAWARLRRHHVSAAEEQEARAWYLTCRDAAITAARKEGDPRQAALL